MRLPQEITYEIVTVAATIAKMVNNWGRAKGNNTDAALFHGGRMEYVCLGNLSAPRI